MVNRERMREQLVLHEGLRTSIYKCTEGFDTIGVGYNVEARGWGFIEEVIGRKVTDGKITKEEALKVLDADIERLERAIPLALPEYADLDEVRQRVVLDMAFNMSFGALKFRKAIAAMRARNWSEVARQLYDSRWARQVGDGPGGKRDRADRLVQMVLTGQDYIN